MTSALRRVPPLVSYCQRAITCLGHDRLLLPSDSLSSDLWERLCFKSYPLLAEQLVQNADQPPESWRDQYFVCPICRGSTLAVHTTQILRKAEAHRLEEVASRIRNQRMEEVERKKEREVKLTDKLPPAKRARTTWSTTSQPLSLFQKTKNDASKLQRTMYTHRLGPKIPLSTVHRPATASPLAASSTKPVDSRIAVKAVSVTRPSASVPQTIPRPVQSTKPTSAVSKKVPISPPQSSSPVRPSSPIRPPSQTTELRPSKPPIQKKDPMAALFMPKHRSLSQLPSQTGTNSRNVPAR
ncbi:hypothetical protein JVU11DRAFT_669 [Chiua virens]|nr:hypothetical protein JVU11DRAFT_669 [Chiua virens]